jgi:Xaa-Pro aminopeptidase
VTPFRARRERLLDALAPRTAAVFVATPTAIRNNDVEHEFRQDSDVYYVSGFDEPETVVVLAPRASLKVGEEKVEPRFVMFVRPRDVEREVWDGYRAGVDGARTEYGADLVFPIDELGRRLPELLLGHDAVMYRWGGRPFDERLFAAIQAARRTAGRHGGFAPTKLIDPVELVHEHRLRKSDDELALMRRACAITAEGHARAMALAAPGRFEHELEAVLMETFRKHGSERAAYGSIVGSGQNATILHYRKNDRRLEDGDLVLIDAGCEYGYYASDVTRTFPANGRFGDLQRAAYEVVLEAEEQAIAIVKPGVTAAMVHDKAVEVLTAGLVKLGVLEGDVAQLVKDEAYKPFYMHKTSHWLGMDVHDVGAYFAPKQGDDGQLAMAHRPLEPGMVLTVEPGLYFGIGADSAKIGEKGLRDWSKYRGIGIRIEDDILVTETGHENLTAAIPKSVEDIERACRG